MKNKNRLVLLLVVLLAVIAIAVIYFTVKDFLKSRNVALVYLDEGIIPPAATGDINNLEEALIKELADENILIEEEDFDIDLVDSEENEIDDFGQSINEDEL